MNFSEDKAFNNEKLLKTIKYCITQSATKKINIFELLVNQIEIYFDRKVNNMKGIKDKHNKKLKGDVWELFCKLYLQSTSKYKRVWLFKEIPSKAKEKIGLSNSTQDNGIDIVCKDFSGKYHSVQCKYRGHGERVCWKNLGTFIGLSERCKFRKIIVMTNSSGVTRKLVKSKKDVTIAKGTFRAIKLREWKEMVGFSEPEVLQENIEIPETIEDLREARLKYFQNKNEHS